jgi:hypothetical protein
MLGNHFAAVRKVQSICWEKLEAQKNCQGCLGSLKLEGSDCCFYGWVQLEWVLQCGTEGGGGGGGGGGSKITGDPGGLTLTSFGAANAVLSAKMANMLPMTTIFWNTLFITSSWVARDFLVYGESLQLEVGKNWETIQITCKPKPPSLCFKRSLGCKPNSSDNIRA